MLENYQPLMDKLALRFPHLSNSVTINPEKNKLTVHYSAYATPGEVKKLESFVAKQKLDFEIVFERIPF